MRLLNTTSRELKEFADDEIPEYAILSHTWGKGEVSFQDMKGFPLPAIDSVSSSPAQQKTGYAKIEGSCTQAVEDKIEYVWIDTCCIDKSSSAELTEAINSMYRWYRNSKVCYAYLSDVTDEESDFAGSRWFTRGWTLQELIAPDVLRFYSSDWRLIGMKDDLYERLLAITGIDIEVLKGASPQSMSVAKRMSWASRRNTSRKEDIAYSLMGLFGVNMPLLYGEGDKAFIRLQQEIMKESDDHSLFAWKWSFQEEVPVWSGLLATSPAFFAEPRNIVPIRNRVIRAPYDITNRGLRIEVALVPSARNYHNSHIREYIAPLDCVDTTDLRGPLGIWLERVPSSLDNQMARIWAHELPHITQTKVYYAQGRQLSIETVYVPQIPHKYNILPEKTRTIYGFQIPQISSSNGYFLETVQPYFRWNEEERILFVPTSIGVAGILLCRDVSGAFPIVVVVVVDCTHSLSIQVESGDLSHNLVEAVYERHSRLIGNDIANRKSSYDPMNMSISEPRTTGNTPLRQGVFEADFSPERTKRGFVRVRVSITEELVKEQYMFSIKIDIH